MNTLLIKLYMSKPGSDSLSVVTMQRRDNIMPPYLVQLGTSDGARVRTQTNSFISGAELYFYAYVGELAEMGWTVCPAPLEDRSVLMRCTIDTVLRWKQIRGSVKYIDSKIPGKQTVIVRIPDTSIEEAQSLRKALNAVHPNWTIAFKKNPRSWEFENNPAYDMTVPTSY